MYNTGMKLIDRPEYAVIRAVLFDAVDHEGGEIVESDEHSAVVRIGDWHKCAFDGVDGLVRYSKERGLKENICVLGMPLDAAKLLNVDSEPCKTFAYMEKLPPVLGGVAVKRLAHTLSSFVAEKYESHGYKMTESEAEEIIRDKGVFGAFINSSLAGFIGRHSDGSMGMLNVFDDYKRRGIGEELEKFMINYVMSYGRIPFCDVYTDNAPSLALQRKLGMTEGHGHTFWIDKM